MKNKLLLLLVAVQFGCSDASAQAWLWGREGITGLKANLFAKSVATNKMGNLYHTGNFQTSLTFGTITLTSGSEDAFLVKYDQNGNILWAKASKSRNGDAVGYGVATDDSDNSYITGYAGDSAVFGSDTLKGCGGEFLVKYDPNGNVLWAYSGCNLSVGAAVTLDNFGHEYVAGFGNNFLLMKYDRNGNIIWIAGTRTSSSASANSVDTDPTGNIYISGYFSDSLNLGNSKLYSANYEAFIAKFDSSGNALWAKQSTGDPGTGSFNIFGGYSVATDMSGSAFLTGTFSNLIKFGSLTFATNGNGLSNYNFFVVKYLPDGTLAWGREAISPVNGGWGTYSISSDDSNHLYISGAGARAGSSGSFVFSNDTVNVTVGSGSNDNPSFLLKLDTSGHVICYSTLPGGGYEVNAVASDPTGKFVYMGGGFYGTFPIANDTLVDNNGGYSTFVARWKPCSPCSFAVTSSPPPPICDGESVTLTVDGAKNYAWSPAAGLSAVTGDTVVATPATTTTYTIVSSITDCTDTEQIAITVNPLPVFSLSPPTPSICNGQYVILTANGNSNNTYTWNPATGLGSIADSSVIAVPSITTTYTVAATLNGCSDSEQIVVHVGAPLVTIIPPNPSVCPGQSILLVAGGATTYLWSPTQSLNSSTGDTVVATPSIQTTYTVVGTNTGGCSASDTDVVSIELGLNTPTITQRGDTLFSSAIQGNQWVRNDTLIPGATNVFYIITEAGWYKVLAINPANGCSTASDSSYLIPTGISQLAINSEQLSVYPNPTGGAIFVNISSSVAEIKNWSLQITDVLRRTVYARQALNYSNDIDISNLSSGVYFITVANKTGRAVVPVVKQ